MSKISVALSCKNFDAIIQKIALCNAVCGIMIICKIVIANFNDCAI